MDYTIVFFAITATLALAIAIIKYYMDGIEQIAHFNQRQIDKFNRVKSSCYHARDDIFGNFEPTMAYIAKCMIPFYGWIHLTKIATRRNKHV